MAKPLTFKLDANEYQLEPIKLDRKKLYGWTELIALDDTGKECQLATMDETGTLMIPKGGIGLGLAKQNGEWLEKSELIALCSDGTPAVKLPSSFAASIELKATATPEDVLDHTITSVYSLQGEENCPDLVSAAKATIYTFPFSFTDSYEPGTGFLVESAGELFILTGEKQDFPFIGFEEAGIIDEEIEDADSDDELDFGMM